MAEVEPVLLQEDEDTGDRFLVYSTDKGIRLDIRYEGEALWMTQAQIAQLFGVDRSVITKHIANVYAEGELDPEATSAKIAQVRQEGNRRVDRQIEHYTLDTKRSAMEQARLLIAAACLPRPKDWHGRTEIPCMRFRLVARAARRPPVVRTP